MKSILEYLSTSITKNVEDVPRTEDKYKAPPYSIYAAESIARIKWSDKAQKMKDWNDGKRRENIKACSDAKLIVYYQYCKDHKYESCCDQCEDEANRRGWTFKKLRQF